ncbi:hypothetical protein, partial [Pseudomonas caricapapayae]|uniref:hypothetical protein n=1 Tax=Pseudomonas caricapapayae TaxID=46678 RepID=UPI001CC1E45B
HELHSDAERRHDSQHKVMPCPQSMPTQCFSTAMAQTKSQPEPNPNPPDIPEPLCDAEPHEPHAHEEKERQVSLLVTYAQRVGTMAERPVHW